MSGNGWKDLLPTPTSTASTFPTGQPTDAPQPTDVPNPSSSTDALISSLLFNAVVFPILIALFLLLRHGYPALFAPKQFLRNPHRRAPQPAGKLAALAWIPAMMRVSDPELLQRAGLDAYMNLRFLRLGWRTFFWFAVLTLPVLLPVNAVGQDSGLQGINLFTMGNVTDVRRFWVHVLYTYLVAAWVLFMLVREMRVYVRLRHAHLTSDRYKHSAQARSLLVTNLPAEAMNESTLRKWFDYFPGGVARVCLDRYVAKRYPCLA